MFCRQDKTIYQMNKKLSATLIIFLTFGINLYADELIDNIKNEYKAVKGELPYFSVDSLNYPEKSTEGSNLKIYKNEKDEIRLLVLSIYGEMGQSKEEYYIKNDSLFFLFVEIQRYNVPFYVDSIKAKELNCEPYSMEKTRFFEHRYYFKEGKMLKWLDNTKKSISINSKAFMEKEISILNYYNEIYKFILNNKQKLPNKQRVAPR